MCKTKETCSVKFQQKKLFSKHSETNQHKSTIKNKEFRDSISSMFEMLFESGLRCWKVNTAEPMRISLLTSSARSVWTELRNSRKEKQILCPQNVIDVIFELSMKIQIIYVSHTHPLRLLLKRRVQRV